MVGLHACVVICVQLVGVYVCIDPRPGWEPCFVPAWLINGVVMAVGRNEGTERRRSASQDPCSRPGTHTVSNTNTNSRCTPYTVLTVMLVAQIRLSVYSSCILIPSLLLNCISPLFMSQNFVSLSLFSPVFQPLQLKPFSAPHRYSFISLDPFLSFQSLPLPPVLPVPTFSYLLHLCRSVLSSLPWLFQMLRYGSRDCC